MATIIFLLLLCFGPMLPSSIGAEPQSATAVESSNQILFLQVHLEQGQMTIVKSTRVPGVLKTPRAVPDRPVTFAVESTNGTALWSNSMEDPVLQRLEYPDASIPGVMHSRVVTNDVVDFTVRVPQTAGADRLSFYRLIPSSAQSASPALVGSATNSQSPASGKELMGSVALPKN